VTRVAAWAVLALCSICVAVVAAVWAGAPALAARTPPRVLQPPAITGTPAVGELLMAAPGAWQPGAGLPAYTWMRCDMDGHECEVIVHQWFLTYVVRRQDVSHTLALRMRVRSFGHQSDAVMSLPTAVVPPPTEPIPPPPSRQLVMSPFPVVRTAGRFTRRRTTFTLVSVRAAPPTRVEARCHGDCPFRRVQLLARRRRVRELERSFSAGAVLEIRVTAPGLIGKFVRIHMRSTRPPARQDRCVLPGRDEVVVACPAG
jgi:hypothetical protein